MTRIYALLCCLALPTGLAAQETPALTPSGDPAPIRAVKLVEAGAQAQGVERVFFGQIAALETVDLSFEVGGRMTVFDVMEGQFLEAGAEIAVLDPQTFQRAVDRAQVQLTKAERDFERTRSLERSNTVSVAQAEDAETARDLAVIALQEARDALEDAVLVAPFRAQVASRLTPKFANVQPGQPIVRLHDMSEVRVEIDVPEQLFQMRETATDVTFTGHSPLFEGGVPLELREFNAETQSIGQSFRVTLALPQDSVTPALIPGVSMSVSAKTSGAGEDVTVLPPSAVEITEDQARVMVYTPDTSGETGTVSWVPVEVSSADGSRIVVTGVAPGAQIVAAGVQLLQEGQTVRPFTGLSIE